MALIPPAAVHQQYGIPTHMLAQWRRQGMGPEYFALGHRSVRYYPVDIDDWLTHQTQHPHRHKEKAGLHVDQVALAGGNSAGNTPVRWNG